MAQMEIKFDTEDGPALKEADENAEYNTFVDKFKPKKTTDDCYTPPNVYEAVAGWVAEEYGANRADFVRPFYPGGDYQRYQYPPGAVVVDNPPFSIFSEIIQFYLFKSIPFFLFAPALTILSAAGARCCSVITQVDITYANGACVKTSFATNLEDSAIRSAPELYRRIKAADLENQRALHKDLPRYVYPPEVLTVSKIEPLSRLGIDFRVPREKCFFSRALEAQKREGKAIFGGGLLLAESEAARLEAARLEAARLEAAQVWALSERERAICATLDNDF